MLLVDGIVHVSAHLLTAFQQGACADSPLHGECLVQFHQFPYPWIDEQIVSDGYLTGGGKTILVQHIGQDGAVEHYVAMIAHEGESLWSRIDTVMPEGVPRAAFP